MSFKISRHFGGRITLMLYYAVAILVLVLTIFLPFSTNGRYVAGAYVLWMILDRHAKDNGSRRSKKFRKWISSGYLINYFPLVIHKVVEIPEDINYIFAGFPHGPASMSRQIFLNGPFKIAFPKINLLVGTLDAFFFVPIIRDILLLGGAVGVSERSFKQIFGGPKKGNAIFLTPGGTKEQILSQPGQHKLYLKRRTGFCRVALQTGAHLVPVYSFGENEIFRLWRPSRGSWLFKVDQILNRNVRFIVAWWVGDHGFGIFPNQHPINVVVGAPIPVQKKENPTNEDISNLHRLFIEKLIALFEQEKHRFVENANATHIEIL